MQEQTKDGEVAADGTTYSMKNMDSSESSSEEDDEQKDQDHQKPKKSKKKEGYEGMETSLKYEQSTWENFKFHSKRAMKKTVTSFVCLAILMIISFIVSSYEYNEVQNPKTPKPQNPSNIKYSVCFLS